MSATAAFAAENGYSKPGLRQPRQMIRPIFAVCDAEGCDLALQEAPARPEVRGVRTAVPQGGRGSVLRRRAQGRPHGSQVLDGLHHLLHLVFQLLVPLHHLVMLTHPVAPVLFEPADLPFRGVPHQAARLGEFRRR
ncbi:hypothetical protein [Kitasatospora sp. NPDC085879]|uniref:hypothetical protein n=1 Tax=Kitasatospora sp. NPDC085879 TaxID=3154769 RepID=UPI003446CCCC